MIGPGYLETMRIPLVSGRDITTHDNDEKQLVVLINESAARELFRAY